jgi:two-component system response regulator FixJ
MQIKVAIPRYNLVPWLGVSARMIFIVDDDEPTRDSLRSLLEAHGFETREFADGRAFLDGKRTADGDCLILDLTMPGMNGFELLAELRRRGNSIPVVIVTAHADPATRSRAAAGGALGLVEKPHRAVELLALVRRALGIGP